MTEAYSAQSMTLPPCSAQSMTFCAIMEKAKNVSLRKTNTLERAGHSEGLQHVEQFKGVLVAISIPIFTSQLEKSREAVDASNIRSAYAEAMTDYLANGAKTAVTKTTGNAKSTGSWVSSPDWNTELTGKVPSSVTQGSPFTVTVAADGTVSVSQ